jgi:hypothetical protein
MSSDAWRRCSRSQASRSKHLRRRRLHASHARSSINLAAPFARHCFCRTLLPRCARDFPVMTSLISLNRQALWTPTAPHSAKPRHEHPLGQIQNPKSTLQALDQNTSPSHYPIVISSDEESDFSDAEDDEADMVDDLPTIADIISKIEESEPSRVDTAGEQSPPA